MGFLSLKLSPLLTIQLISGLENMKIFISVYGDVVFLEIHFIKETSTKWLVNCPGPCPYSVYFVFVSTTLVTNEPTSVRPAPKMPSMQSGVLYLD